MATGTEIRNIATWLAQVNHDEMLKRHVDAQATKERAVRVAEEEKLRKLEVRASKKSETEAKKAEADGNGYRSDCCRSKDGRTYQWRGIL